MPGHLLLPSEPIQLPLLPLRDVVVFPHMVIPLFVGRPKSIKALEAAMETGKNVLLVAQKTAAKDEPGIEDLYEVGCIANILVHMVEHIGQSLVIRSKHIYLVEHVMNLLFGLMAWIHHQIIIKVRN